MCKNDYGSGIAEYLRKAFRNNLFNNNIEEVKEKIKSQLKIISNGGIDESKIQIEQDPNDPTTININLNMNVPVRRFHNYVVLDPAKDRTHTWAGSYKQGLYKCSTCGMHKLLVNSKDVDDSIVGSHITVADYTCDEMSIKDIIE